LKVGGVGTAPSPSRARCGTNHSKRALLVFVPTGRRGRGWRSAPSPTCDRSTHFQSHLGWEGLGHVRTDPPQPCRGRLHAPGDSCLRCGQVSSHKRCRWDRVFRSSSPSCRISGEGLPVHFVGLLAQALLRGLRALRKALGSGEPHVGVARCFMGGLLEGEHDEHTYLLWSRIPTPG
jgi:hypothetical protein